MIKEGLIQKEKKSITIVFNEDSKDRYNQWYMKNNPRTKKPPIEDNIPPLLNMFTSKVRIVQNSMKQKWKDYALWRLNDMGIEDVNIKECEVKYHTILPSKRRADLDGLMIAAKFINDAITEYGGIWEDDCYTIIKSLSFSAEYQKGSRELYITITY